MLTIDAETVLTDLDVLEEDGVNYDAQLPSLILEYVSSRWGAERGEAILKELFQYIIDTGSATYDQLYRRSLIVNQSAPINPENEAFYVPLIDFDIRFKELVNNHDEEDGVGIVIYSAIRYGFLLDVDLVRDFYKSDWIEGLNRYGNNFWYLLKKPKFKTEFVWSPDDLTLLLINLMGEKRVIHKSYTWYKYVKLLFMKYGSFEEIPSMTEFMSVMCGFLKNKVPSYLVDSATNLRLNRGLCENGHIRKISGLVPPKLDVGKIVTSPRRSISNVQSDLVKVLKGDPDLRSYDLFSRGLALSKSQRSIINCIRYYMENDTEYGNRLKPSGLSFIANAAFDRFASLFDELDPEVLSNENLLERFIYLIESLDSSPAKSVRRCINYYLWYLHNTQDRGLSEIQSMKIVLSEQSPVILLPTEYDHLYSVLESAERIEINSYRISLLRATRLALILGYRLGLRASEVKHVRAMDFHLRGFAELLIEPYVNHSLKTISSYRSVGISGRLMPEEMSFLKGYHPHFLESGRNADARILEFKSGKSVNTNNNYIFKFLCQAIRSITGDIKTAFHTLRHSFASNNIAMMLSRKWDQSSRESLYLPSEIQKEYKEYLARMNPEHNGSRTAREIHQLAREIGHASPSTTFKSYIHSIDDLRPFYQKNMHPQFSTAELACLLGVSRQAIQKNAEPDPETHLRALSDYRGMILRQLKRKVPEIQLTGWRSVDEALTGAVSDYGSRRFDSFVQQFRYYKTGKTSARQLLVRYPGLTELPRDFRRDSRTGQLLKSTTSKIDKRVIERIMENLLAIPPQKREEAYYRWSLIADAVVSQKSLTQLKNLSERQIAAQAFLMRLSQEVVESTEKE
tara:strand:+ start:92 stop:2656 length:2565 start_codon:yes stop_codon:yes gene_type:complete